ncbi:ferritin-like domain-containing protein [Streptomyces sp. NPDC093272]|uniref:ferritin-like domain-containing protein n=1 Tax=unclassified Streptomyces TaxID=2593676 RepID=UPI0034366B84
MGVNRIDDRLLRQLTEESQDLNSSAVRRTGTEFGQLDGRTSRNDVMALQTAASLENLAVDVYRTAAGLPFIRHGNKTVAAFIGTTISQHSAHARAFNSAVTRAGGRAQHSPDPRYAAVVKQALPKIKGPADVVALAITLEDVAAQTYTKNTGQVHDARLRTLFASIAPVEAQHRAVLLAVQALLKAGKPQLVALPTRISALPSAAGSVGFPSAFYSVKNASPITEGAVR